MEHLSNILTSPYLYSSAVTLLLLIALKAIIGQFITQQPLAFFNFYCQRLADKVNKQTNSSRQQNISGLIAVLVTLIPIIAILWLFEVFIEVQWLWHALLLYFALGSFGLTKTNKNIARELVANNNYQAKQKVAPLLLRDTEQLSPLGISKACIEMQVLRSSQLLVCVGFYFLFFGPLAALAFRLLLEMHYAWNIKMYRFVHFGAAVNYIVKLLQWLPSRLFSLLLLIGTVGQNTLLYWRLIRGKFFQLDNGILLHVLALGLEIKLSGVAMYNGSKVRKTSFNDHARQPQATDIIHASKRINYALYILILLVMLLAVTSYSLSGMGK
ncbi:cobalamin biosynthesis protein CobD/CbiB [Cognaticolwellia beringensis]|uniref:Cobalamin biosynthesis protein CbiB n=1 Tax=Cognaticolwellia beringensis TaxID=1967665 RepID=A0A222G6J6_9GAMM|nr:cobalamin biosynthesis protein [Cognaticolwellia beringensis]ASP47479.1 cobalamin biosynthesis protein CbiB [Cognaticolwellia beringensis]